MTDFQIYDIKQVDGGEIADRVLNLLIIAYFTTALQDEMRKREEEYRYCRVYLVSEDCHPEKLPALEKAVELKLIDGYCIGDLAAEHMRTWLSETAETISGRSAR